MTRIDSLKIKRIKRVLIIVAIAEAVTAAHIYGASLAYRIELEDLQIKIIKSDRIPVHVKEELIHNYQHKIGDK